MVALFKPDNLIDFPQPTKSVEWYTPSRYIEAARLVMGSIDLDPASCEVANRTVKATRFYSQQENGLLQPWFGHIWLNPPYHKNVNGKSNQQVWTDHLIAEYEMGNVQEAILLVTASTEVMWFQNLWTYPICFSVRKDRVRFYSPSGETLEHSYGTAFAYLGSNEQKFIDIFSKFGTIAKRVSQPRQTVQPLSLWGGVL